MDLKCIVVVVMLLSAVFGCQQPSNTEICLKLGTRFENSEAWLTVGDSTYHVALDSAGIGKVTLAERFAAGYAGLFARGWTVFYVEPGKSFEAELKDGVFYFRGEGADKNQYLNSDFFRNFRCNYSLKESEFFHGLDKRLKDCYVHLDSLNFDKKFVALEKQRLYYDVFIHLALFPGKQEKENSKVSSDFPDSLFVKMEEKEELIGMSEYRHFFRQMVETYCKLVYSPSDDLQALQQQLNFIDHFIKGKQLAAYLTDIYMNEYMNCHGVDGLEKWIGFYYHKVSDPAKVRQFDTLYVRWAKVAKGQPSPDFRYPDTEGREVSLSDLRGKYVYIDLWATWCYFCCREIPALKKMEQQMKNRNICFVSISCDKDTLVWKKKIKEEKLGGIQLICRNDFEFRKIYQVEWIPRFILIDPEGKIVNANMSRPSDPKTLQMLEKLPGI